MKILGALRLLITLGLLSGSLSSAKAAPQAPADCNPGDFARTKHQLEDWAGLDRYRTDNQSLPAVSDATKRIVFFGDSITDAWGRLEDTGTFFPGKSYINRGIGGQTTPQMLVRFEQDVIHLQPSAVVILAGTNDIAGNTGPSTPQMVEDNYKAMTELATASGIKVILASITPADHYTWKPAVKPVEEIRELNAWMKQYCGSGACTYLDYYSAMSDAQGAMLPGFSKDGVHPTSKGYGVMGPLAEQAIAKALAH
jgi:acyl-CoA thioesterase-1